MRPATRDGTAGTTGHSGACSPKLADAPIGAGPDIAALRACGGGVAETVPGRTRLVRQDPRTIAALSDDTAVHAACERARATLKRVLDRLAGQSGPVD